MSEMRHNYPYGKTKQFLDMEMYLATRTDYVGDDETGEPVYDHTRKKAVITAVGTVKLHGTNASICYNSSRGVYFQSRYEIVTKGHNGFVHCMETHDFHTLFNAVYPNYLEDLPEDQTICIYGEWAGKGIADGNTAVRKLDKRFYIFDVAIKSGEDTITRGYPTNALPKHSLYIGIESYGIVEIEIDFNSEESVTAAKTKMFELTNAYEKECPVGKAHGISGIGEGLVWTFEFGGKTLRFKTKGEEHRKGGKKEPKKKSADTIESEKLVREFVTTNMTDSLLQEVLSELGITSPTKAETGLVLHAVKNKLFAMDMPEAVDRKMLGKIGGNTIREVYFKYIAQ